MTMIEAFRAGMTGYPPLHSTPAVRQVARKSARQSGPVRMLNHKVNPIKPSQTVSSCSCWWCQFNRGPAYKRDLFPPSQ
jgi:hypothetical protein